MTANGQTVPLTTTPVTGTQTLITAATIGLNWCTPGGSTLGVVPIGGGVGTTLPPPDFCIDPITGITYTYTFAAYATDHLGTVRAILTTNPDGTTGLQTFDYEAFGVEIISPSDIACGNTHRFTGHERDLETGNDYMHFRYFAAGMGRFMKPDSKFDNAAADPQGFNLYSYVHGNPLNFNDPTGHEEPGPATVPPNQVSPAVETARTSPLGGNEAARAAAAPGKAAAANGQSKSEVQTEPAPPPPDWPTSGETAGESDVVVEPPPGWTPPRDPGLQEMSEWGMKASQWNPTQGKQSSNKAHMHWGEGLSYMAMAIIPAVAIGEATGALGLVVLGAMGVAAAPALAAGFITGVLFTEAIALLAAYHSDNPSVQQPAYAPDTGTNSPPLKTMDPPAPGERNLFPVEKPFYGRRG